MRTHIFNQMTAHEIDEYLSSGKDAIFVALGTTEIHGAMPVEANNVLAEGLAVALAEKSDALALVNLPFFYPGGTAISSGTIRISMRDSFDYLWKILVSLTDQGFKRLFIVPGNEGISIFVRALIRDFYEAKQIHPILIDLESVLKGAQKIDGNNIFSAESRIQYMANAAKRLKEALPDQMAYERLICGAYSIMGKVDHLVVDPNCGEYSEQAPHNPIVDDFANRAKRLGGTAGVMYETPMQYGGGCIFHSIEERDRVCAENEKKLRDAVDALDLEHLLQVVKEYQEYSLEVCEIFPRFKKLTENR